MTEPSPTELFEQLIQRLNAECLPKAGGNFRDGQNLPEMVVIPAGSFMMGSPEDEPGRERNEGPQHLVHVDSFALGKYPVTQAQWEAVMGEGSNPSYFNRKSHYPHWGDYPVESVDWHLANYFARTLFEQTNRPYRLPTEAEWEYACRAGTTTAYPWGDTISRQDAHFNCPDEAIGTSTVAGPPNAFGLCDMLGNVWELVTDDDHDTYDGAPDDGSAWKIPDRRVGEEVVKRGGSWDLPGECLRCATRSWADPDEGDNLTGFRIAMSLHAETDTIHRVEAGVVNPEGERLTLIYGDMNAPGWNGGLPVMRFAKPANGTLVVQLLIGPDTPDYERLITEAERQINHLLLRINILPPWDYTKYRVGCTSNVYGEWHWGYVPDESQTPSEPCIEPEAQTEAITEPAEQQDDALRAEAAAEPLPSLDPRKRWYHFEPITHEQPPTNTHINSPDERRRAFKEYLPKLNQALSELGEAQRRICPCCGYPTLQLEFVYEEQCEICFWEDVGESPEYNSHAIHGQRAYSLAEARQHFDVQPHPSFREHRQLRPIYDWLILSSDRAATWRVLLEHAIKVHAKLDEIAKAKQNPPEQEPNEVGLTLPDAPQATPLGDAPSNSNQSTESDAASGDWQSANDNDTRRYQLRAEIMSFREDINHSETMFRVSATWWHRRRWMLVLMAVGTLFFGFPGALACLGVIGMMMYIDPMGKASRQAVAAEICLTLSKELADLLHDEPDNLDYLAGKLAALRSLQEQLIRLQQDTPQEVFDSLKNRMQSR